MKADLWVLKLYVTYIQNFLGLTAVTGFSIIPTFRRPNPSPSSGFCCRSKPAFPNHILAQVRVSREDIIGDMWLYLFKRNTVGILRGDWASCPQAHVRLALHVWGGTRLTQNPPGTCCGLLMIRRQ